VGPEIWHQPLAEVIREQAEHIADAATRQLPEAPDRLRHAALRVQTTVEMTAALQQVGDRYLAADGVLYSLCEEPALEPHPCGGSLDAVRSSTPPVVDEVLRFEDLPLGSSGSRRAVVRWSDGSQGEALRWFADELMMCEGDLVGRSQEQLRALHFRRDRDWLQS
jgi:hypothetical protein